MDKILKSMISKQDKKYLAFQSSLIPTIDSKYIIGVRTNELRKLAKSLVAVYEKPAYDKKMILSTSYTSKLSQSENSFTKKDVDKFLMSLPHIYFDENQLHAFVISQIKDFDICIELLTKFLPYINNWATCDQLSPKCFKKNRQKLIKFIYLWTKSKKAYIVRFAIGMLMQHFLDEDFDKKYLKLVSEIKFSSIKQVKTLNVSSKKKLIDNTISLGVDTDPDLYYVEMMRAWFFATALAKQYSAALPYIKKNILNTWTHNKTIQKAIESYRVSEEHKNELKKYRKH